MRDAILRICAEAEAAIDEGYSLVVLSDRAIVRRARARQFAAGLRRGAPPPGAAGQTDADRVGPGDGRGSRSSPSLPVGGLRRRRHQPVPGVRGSLAGPRDGWLDATEFPDDRKVVSAYRMGVAKGLLKVMAKMGISTLQSYKGAQIFEAVGLNDEVIDLCFVGTASRIQGVGLKTLAEETLRRHELGYPRLPEDRMPLLPNPGEFHWRAEGERHSWSPEAIAHLQVAARTGDREAYWRFAKHLNEDARARCTLRGLLRFKFGVQRPSGAAGRSRTGGRHRQAILHGCDELRLDFLPKPTRLWPSP